MLKFIIFLSSYLFWSPLALSEMTHIFLEVGESQSLDCNVCRNIQLSRKGIIQVLEGEGDQSLYIVALRSGTVLLSLIGTGRHFLVKVQPEKEVKNKILGNKLTKAADLKVEPYWLEIQAIVLDRGSGVERDLKLKEPYGEMSIEGLLKAESFLGFHAETIAHPWLRVIAGNTYHIQSGGEIGGLYQFQDRPIETWKPYGFHLQIDTKSQKDCSLGVQYHLKISRPQDKSSSRTLKKSEASGYTNLRCQDKQLLAILNFESLQSRSHKWIFLSLIPIIGPLFANHQQSDGKVHLAIYATLKTIR